MSIKPRRVDFDLFHQSPEAENCYGPFRSPELTDDLTQKEAFDWAGPDRLIWEGWFDSSRVAPVSKHRLPAAEQRDMVVRLDFYVGERDLLGVGFSDNVIFRKQYYLRAVSEGPGSLSESLESLRMYLYADEDFSQTSHADELPFENGRWTFSIAGTGFEGTLGVSLARVV
jgi:hypothetical protein